MPNEHNVSWPGWEVVRTIGHGSFGAVYEIQRNTFGHIESAALKVITIPDKASDIEDLYNDGYTVEDVTMRFQGYLEDIIREYSLMVDMKGHSNVVYCDDFRYVQHEDGIGWDIYIKMELLTPLTKALAKEIDERQVMDLGIDICSALVMCRERNIVHRDIKPQNIFVSKDGTYKLGDFGIAKTAERTTSGTKIGTYKYMAPEVYNNQPYGAGADIYSLGLLMYWMLNERRTPFLPLPPQVPSSSMEDEARKRRFLGEEIPAPVHGSEELKAIVLKACAYDPKERFASAADMRDALLRLRDGAAVVIGAGVAAAAAAGAATEKGTQSDGMQEILEIVCSDAGTGAVIFSASADETGGTPESADAPEDHTAPESDTAPEVTAEEEKTTDHSAEKAEPKKRKPILWIVLAALLALCVGIVLFMFGRKVEVPDMIGLSQSEAAAVLAEAGLNNYTFTEDYDEYTAAGQIIDQSAAGGESIRKWDKLELVASRGPKPFDMPAMTGKKVDDAKKALEEKGLVVTVEYKANNTVEANHVVSQSAAAGTSVKRGDKVTLVVSAGKETLTVKNVVGMSKDEAVNTLKQQGFEVSVKEANSPTVAAGKISAQDPAANSSLMYGSKVTLTVSTGPKSVKVTLNANGGSVSTSSVTVTHGAAYGSLPTPTRTGYSFLGWYTASSGGSKVSSDSKVSNDSAHTLYARWAAGGYTVAFDACGGSVSPSSATVTYGATYASLPTPTRTGYSFQGWYTASSGGSQITANTTVSASKAHTLYAHWTVKSYTVSWSTGTGYTITVKRTSSPNKGAASGSLSSGAAVYYGDVLEITYAAKTGYSIATKGSEAITVTGNVTKDKIYATATVKNYTYNIKYVSSNGTALGTATAKYAYGTTNTITPKAFSGYTTPASQSVKWDSTSAKTITFTYKPNSVSTSQALKSNQWWWQGESGADWGVKYTAKAEYRNRTADSVQIRIVWTQTIKNAWFGYNQYFYASLWHNGQNKGNTGSVKIASTSTWPVQSAYCNGSVTATSGWVTVPLNTTQATTVYVACDWWTESNDNQGSWENVPVKIPAY